MTPEQRIASLGGRISKIYKQANEELTEKVDSFFANFEKLDKKQKALVDAGKLSEEDYKKWRKNKLLMGEKYKQLRDNVGQTMLEANKTAAAYINREIIPSYATGYNFEGKSAEDKLNGYSFDLINENAVKRLTTSNKTILPYKVVDGRRDVRWNTKKVNSAVLQGIIQGESSKKIAKRLMNITEMNKDSAIRNARTALTGAHNSGRQDAMHKLSEDGVIVQKEWFATAGDSRTRDAHLELHHVVVDEDKPFVNSIGRIMFPGDPNAHPANVYNCRCSIATVIKGFRKGMEPEPEDSHVIAEGQDISETWERRSDEFDFEIEDIMNAQGFDGLPRVVSKEEFDKAVEESNFIAQRTYTAPDKETLDAYRDQLYHGDWYVDCSTGGAQYGQGMYCAADYNGKLTDGIKAEMAHYQKLGTERYAEQLIPKSEEEAISYIKDFYKMDDTALKMARKTAYDDEFMEWMNKQSVETKRGFGAFKAEVEKVDLGRLDIVKVEAPQYTETLTLAKNAKVVTYDEIMGKYKDEYLPKHSYELQKNKIYDVGSYAASLGYDAINAEGHGESGSYTVILNRTKCIFLGGD